MNVHLRNPERDVEGAGCAFCRLRERAAGVAPVTLGRAVGS